MTTFSLRGPSHEPRAPEGVAPHAEYDGPHGPVFIGYGDERHSTRVWGPHVPDAFLGVGPVGRQDGEPVAFYMRPVPIRVGPLSGEVVRADWSLLNRRRRGIVISLDSRSYLYRVAGFVARQLLEREDGTPVTILSGLTGENQIAEDADAVDVAVSLLMVYGVPISAIKAQA